MRCVTIAKTAAMLDVSESQVRALIDEGRLKKTTVGIGKKRQAPRVLVDSIEKLIELREASQRGRTRRQESRLKKYF